MSASNLQSSHFLYVETFPSGQVELRRTPSKRIATRVHKRSLREPITCHLSQTTPSNLISEFAIVKNHKSLRSGHGLPSIPNVFRAKASRTIYEACIALETFDKENVYFITFTLPGNTTEAFRALENYSSYVIKRLNASIYYRLGKSKHVWVWEYQKRECLHLHYEIHIPPQYKHKFTEEKLRKTWRSILRKIGAESGVNMFESLSGESWESNPSKIRVKIENVQKSLAGYLSKQNTKAPQTTIIGRLVGPARWYWVSAALRALQRDMTIRTTLYFDSAEEKQRFEASLLESIAPGIKPEPITNPFNQEQIGMSVRSADLNYANDVLWRMASHHLASKTTTQDKE